MEFGMEVIAERSLTLSLGGVEKPIKVLIGRPYAELDGAYFCPYRVTGVDSEQTRRAGGVDGIQAIQLAFVMIGAELSAHAGSVKWNDSLFPGFPKSIHDPALGEGEE